MFKSKNKMQLRVLAILAIVLTALFLTGCLGSASKVGVVDRSKIMTESPKVKELQEQLNAKGTELTQNLEKEQSALSAEDYQAKEEMASMEFAKLQQELVVQLNDSVKKAVEEVSKEKKMDIIIYKDVVVNGGVDITDDVIKKMQ